MEHRISRNYLVPLMTPFTQKMLNLLQKIPGQSWKSQNLKKVFPKIVIYLWFLKILSWDSCKYFMGFLKVLLDILGSITWKYFLKYFEESHERILRANRLISPNTLKALVPHLLQKMLRKYNVQTRKSKDYNKIFRRIVIYLRFVEILSWDSWNYCFR